MQSFDFALGETAGMIRETTPRFAVHSLEAIQALGGAAFTKDWPVERFARDVKLLAIGPGTNEIRRMLIGRELIGGAP